MDPTSVGGDGSIVNRFFRKKPAKNRTLSVPISREFDAQEDPADKPRMKVGVLDLLSTPALTWSEAAYDFVMTKQYASLTPQAISVWGRRSAAVVSRRPRRRRHRHVLTSERLRLCLARLWQRRGTRTVVGPACEGISA
jgi:hypothetical protein